MIYTLSDGTFVSDEYVNWHLKLDERHYFGKIDKMLESNRYALRSFMFGLINMFPEVCVEDVRSGSQESGFFVGLLKRSEIQGKFQADGFQEEVIDRRLTDLFFANVLGRYRQKNGDHLFELLPPVEHRELLNRLRVGVL